MHFKVSETFPLFSVRRLTVQKMSVKKVKAVGVEYNTCIYQWQSILRQSRESVMHLWFTPCRTSSPYFSSSQRQRAYGLKARYRFFWQTWATLSSASYKSKSNGTSERSGKGNSEVLCRQHCDIHSLAYLLGAPRGNRCSIIQLLCNKSIKMRIIMSSSWLNLFVGVVDLFQ